MLCFRASNVTLRRLGIEDCTRSADRAFIDIHLAHDILLDGMEFLNNTNTKGPSCISSTQSTVTLRSMAVVGNSGSMVMENSTIDVQDSTFHNNDAIGPGFIVGAIKFMDCDLSVSNTVFEGNRGDEGGAVYVSTGVSNLLSASFSFNFQLTQNIIPRHPNVSLFSIC